jgi:anti-sigma B factor antagonist
MQINEQTQGAVTVLKPDGALTQDDAEQFMHKLAEVLAESSGRVVVDLSSVPFVDRRGLEVLVEANDTLAVGGRSLKLCAINETIREVLDLTGLATRFDHFDDTNSALRSFH